MNSMIKSLITLAALTFAFGACGVEDPSSEPSPAPTCTGDCNKSKPTPTPKSTCGDGTCDQGETATSCASDCAQPTPVKPTYAACPFKTDGASNWNVAGAYISGATKGEIRFFTAASDGSYPNPQVLDSNNSGYLGMSYETQAGTYRFSYLGYQYSSECTGSDCPVAWAQYGSKATLATLSAECRAFIECNWWDSDQAAEVSVDCASCSLKVEVKSDGTIVGAGNMANFAE